MDLFRLESALATRVVTASGGVSEEASLAAANVVTVTRDEIARNGWRSLGELLAFVPGLYVIDDLVLAHVGVRGVTGGLGGGTRIVKVMVNGVAVNFRPDLTAFLGPEFIPMEAVEQVEIAKGPLSALYGANAFLATVNVITRRPPPQLAAELSGRAYLIQGRGGYGGSGLVSYAGGSWEMLAAVSSERQDRSGVVLEKTFPGQENNPDRFGPLFGPSEGDLALPASAYVQLRRDVTGLGALALQGGMELLDSMGEFQLSSVRTHKSRVARQVVWGNLRWERKWSEAVTASASLGLSDGRPTRDERLFYTGDDTSFYTRNFAATAVDGDFKLTATLVERLSATLGADLQSESHRTLYLTQVVLEPTDGLATFEQRDRVEPGDQLRASLSNVGAYVQVSGAPTLALPDLRLTGNVRLDFPSLFSPQFSWRAAAAYRWSDNATTKVIVGSAFQSPSATLLYAVRSRTSGEAHNVVGSETTLPKLPALRPQSVLSAEAVASARLFDHVALDAAVFWQRVQDRIEFVQVFRNFVAQNQGVQQILGAEATVRLFWGRFTGHLSGCAQAPLGDGGLDPAALPLFPVAWGQARLSVELPEAHVNLAAAVRVVAERGASQSNIFLNNLGRGPEPYALPAYATADLTLSTAGIKLFEEAFETKGVLAVRNLLDEHHAEPGFGGFDVPNLGRTFILELRQGF